jgi:hypothetical protein
VPTKLIVPPLIRHLVTELETAGNCGNTIAARLWGLRTALGIMCPEGDFRWITSPDGHDVRSVFLSERRPIRIYHPLLLYRWGIQLMEQALQMNNPIIRAIKYRNGLLIAVLAARAPRLRSLAAIRIGIQLVRHETALELPSIAATAPGRLGSDIGASVPAAWRKRCGPKASPKCLRVSRISIV